MTSFIFILIVILIIGFAVYGFGVFSKRNLRYGKFKKRYLDQQAKLKIVSEKLSVIEEKVTKYFNSLDQDFHKLVVATRSMQMDVDKLLQKIDVRPTLDTIDELECIVTILEDSASVTDIQFCTEDHVYYESMRGWNKKLLKNIEDLARSLVDISDEFSTLKLDKEQRRATLLSLKAAGIFVPDRDKE